MTKSKKIIKAASLSIPSSLEILPRLKVGVRFSRSIHSSEESIFVGNSQNFVEVLHPGARTVISRFNGFKSAQEISDEISVPVDLVERMANELESGGLLDTKKGKITLQNRYFSENPEKVHGVQDQSRDAAYLQLQTRIAPELSQATWIDGVYDGGVSKLSARQNFVIEIYGGNRIASLLYAMLLASGVTQTRFAISARRSNPTVSDSDLGTGILRNSDIGENYKVRIAEISREIALFPSEINPTKQTISEKNLSIMIGDFSSETMEHVMREGQNHLFIHNSDGPGISFGPLVIPGKTPCIRCIELSIEERTGMRFETVLNAQRESGSDVPIAIAHHVAGLVTQLLLSHIDSNSSELIGVQIRLDYRDPISPKRTSYPRHPGCGCSWL